MTDFPEVKLKALPTFPAVVTAASPILLTKTGGAYSIALDENQLRQDIGAPSIADVQAYSAAAQTSATNAAASASAAASSASFLASSLPTYATRAVAAAATISTSFASIVIVRHTAGYPAAPAVYVPGTSSGPMAFQEAGGHYWQLDLTGGVVDPRWFGAKGDGVNDDTSALQNALTNAIGGKKLLIPAGTWGISATLDGSAGNVRIFGEGKSRSILQVLGTNVVDPVLKFTDSNDVTIEDIDFFGNSVQVTIGAIQFLVTAGSNVIGNYNVRRNFFRNFKASYWMRFLTNVASTSHTRRMRYIRVIENDFVSSSGNAVDFTSVAQPSACIAIQGSVDNNGSYVDDVIVSGNFADCGAIKGFINCWAGARNVMIDRNVVLNAGALGINDRGCYAMMAYNNQASADMTYAPQDINVINNTIISARSMGFYGASASRCYIIGNIISGVQDNTAASLPYAAISLGQCEDSKANFNELNDNYVSIQAIPTAASATIEAIGNKIKTSVASAIAIRSTVVGSFATKARILNNQIIMSGSASTGINCASVGAGFEYDKLDIIGNRVSALGTGILCNDSSGGGIRANGVLLQDNHVEGALATSAIDVSSAVAKTQVIGGSINLVNAGASCLGFVATSAVSVHIDGLQIANRSTGTAFAFSSSSANGSMKNVNMIGIARANLPADGSTHMGFALPTVTATGIGQFIQNLATTSYTPQGSAGSQYTIDGWIYATGTTWYPRRCLTGT